jgi:nitrogen regulatory protein P-II 2
MSTPADQPSRSAMCLVTIVAENVLEGRLLHLLEDCGAKGWTVTPARGAGPRNRRAGDLDGGNVRIESVVPRSVAEAVLHRLEEEYFQHYALVTWVTGVEVSRTDHFV